MIVEAHPPSRQRYATIQNRRSLQPPHLHKPREETPEPEGIQLHHFSCTPEHHHRWIHQMGVRSAAISLSTTPSNPQLREEENDAATIPETAALAHPHWRDTELPPPEEAKSIQIRPQNTEQLPPP